MMVFVYAHHPWRVLKLQSSGGFAGLPEKCSVILSSYFRLVFSLKKALIHVRKQEFETQLNLIIPTSYRGLYS